LNGVNRSVNKGLKYNLELRWWFYKIDGIFYGYDHTNYSEIPVYDDYGIFDGFEHINYNGIHVEYDYVLGINADEFEDMISFDGYDDIEYEFELNGNRSGNHISIDGYDHIMYYFHLNIIEEYEIIILDDDNFNNGPPPTSKYAIESLPTHVIYIESECACCCICIDPIRAGDEAKILPCNHFYHSEGIIKWLGISNFCPLCWYQLPSNVDGDQHQNWKVDNGIYF